MIEIRPISLENKKEREAFIAFAWKIYKNDPYWVPPLLMDMRQRLNPSKHPFFEIGQIQAFMAYRNGSEVGRIAAIDNRLYNESHKSNIGFWGFFESIDDQEIANLLFNTAKNWLKSRGRESMHGPASPSSNYDFGLLVEGFDDEPRIMMTYNPRYYVTLVEKYGFKKNMGLLAYRLDEDKVLKNEKFLRVQKIARERSKVTVRFLNKSKMKQEAEVIKKIYNKAWENNWGFVPMTDKELDTMVAELKMVVQPNLVPILENEKGEPIGLALALPDFNYILKQMNGRLLPFNIFKFFTQRKHIKWIRILLLGLLPEARNKGLDAVLYHELITQAVASGYKIAEASWILEDNPAMNKGLEVVNGEVYKRYNVYEFIF